MAITQQYYDYTLTQHGQKWKVWNGKKTVTLPLEQAQEVVKQLIDAKRAASDLSEVKTITVAKALELYEQYASVKRDVTTIRNVKLTWTAFSHITWLHDVTRKVVEEHLAVKKRSNGTRRAILFNIRSVLSFANDSNSNSNKKVKTGNKYHVDASIYNIDLPDPDSKVKLEATDAHVEAAISYFSNADWRLQMLIRAITSWGCRPATIPELLVADYTGTSVSLRAAKAKNKKQQVMIVTPELKPLLDRAAKENSVAAGGSGYLFHSSDGKPWSIEGVQAVMKRLHTYKVLPIEITWYSFRIKKDNQLIKEKTDPYAHSKLMGHSPRTVLESYSRLKIEDMIVAQQTRIKPIKYTDPVTNQEISFATVEELTKYLTAAK